MTCPRCSAANADQSRYCAVCGARLGAAPAGNNPGTLWLVLNIVLTVLSCCTNVLSIVGIVFGAIAVSRFGQGRIDEAWSNANVSKWLLISGLILLVAGTLAAVLAGLLPFFLGLVALIAAGMPYAY